MNAAAPRKTRKSKNYRSYNRLNTGFIVLLVILSVTSCFAIYNTFNLISYGSGLSNLVKQMLFFVLGFFLMFAMRFFQNPALIKLIDKAYKYLMYCLIYLAISRTLNIINPSLYLPLTPPVNGATSWFQIPLISFQPSEFMKVVLIVQSAQMITAYQDRYPEPTVANDLQLFAQILFKALPPLALIFYQPDTGLCLIIVFTLLVLLLCSGIRPIYIWLVLLVVAFALGGFIYLYTEHQDILNRFIASYRLQRIEAWLHPDDYIRGSSNQLYTALLSLGSAGLTGHGLQANIISIPEAHTDFIFAAFGQCFGLVGTSFLLIISFLLDIYLAGIALRVENRTDKFIIIGTIAMLFYQQIQNLGMIVGLLPITGITLPLISYGGSSTLSYFLAFGLILNMKEKKQRSRSAAQ